ncbi:Suppressor of G2 allele of SKP1, partial [Perkinsus olseni]
MASIPPSKLDWYQTADTVTITIKLKGVDPSTGIENIEFGERSVKATINHDEKGSVEHYRLDLELWGSIKADKATYEITPYKVELHLPKGDNQPQQWPSLRCEKGVSSHRSSVAAPKVDKTTVSASESSSYPSSSKVRRDWSAIDKMCDEELKGEKENGDAALNALFRQIYADANEDTRRAMVKSFQTSGGTVLSTNWDEVGKADYEGKDRPDAPDGQEWRNCQLSSPSLMSSPSSLSPQYKILLITLLCLRLCQGVCLNIRHLDDETPAAAVVPPPTPEHKRHGYHRAELIGAWIIITVVPVACIVFFCVTAPRVRQREILFKLFHRDAVFTAPAAAVEMKDLELGSTAGSSSSPRAAGSSSWWDRLRGRSKAAARAGGGMAATVIGKAKPVIKSAAAKIDRSRVKRHHRKQTQRGFRQLGGQDGGDHVKYNIYDDEDNTTFGGFDGPSPSSLSSSPSSSWSSSLVSSSRDESSSSSSAAAAVVGASSSLDLIGYYDYYQREGEVHQEFRKEAVVTTTGDLVQASESTVRRVSFDAPPAMDVEEGPQITEVSNDNNSSNSGATMPTMVVEEPPDESPGGR